MASGIRVEPPANPAGVRVDGRKPDSRLDRVVGPVIGEVSKSETVEGIGAASEGAAGYRPGALLIHPRRERPWIGAACEVIEKKLGLCEVRTGRAEEQEKPVSHSGECPGRFVCDSSSKRFMLDPHAL